MFGFIRKSKRKDMTGSAPPLLKVAPIVKQLWDERPDLQAAFDLDRHEDRYNLALWFLFHGLRETAVIVDRATLQEYEGWLGSGPPDLHSGPFPVSWLMREAAIRAGYTPSDLANPALREGVVRWFFLEAMDLYNWSSLLTANQAAGLMAVDEDNGVPLIARWIWDTDEAWHPRFSGPGDPEFLAMLRERGGIRWPLLAHPDIGLANGLRPPPNPGLPFGVNLVGHPRGRFGIGEDVRMAALALLSAGVPFGIRDISENSLVGAEDHTFDQYVTDQMPYRYTVFCTTGMDTVRAVNFLGKQSLEGQFIIGFWPWELPEFPDIWRKAYTLVDEVWASTRYTRDAYVRSSPVPVRQMPMVVTCGETDGLDRAHFGLPDNRFLFVFAYDALSYSARKNPDACLEAFDRAFPRGDEPVGLVIKGIRAKESPAWKALEQRAAQDPRLFLIDRSLERGALLDLYRACDCFVSLHRAEGFGRNIAECMMLGLPVIVTAHSGNLDFTRWDTAALVPVRLRNVAPGEYPFGAGQIWADPDVDEASKQMHRMATDRSWRQRLAAAGQQCVADLYAVAPVGQQWIETLNLLEQQFALEIEPVGVSSHSETEGHGPR